uniref:Chondroitin proteoglycan 4 domain-containing protein n=1 Tax=Acrobeloides nanus TaxID=290746 RepID=A0A914DCR7_9BILA
MNNLRYFVIVGLIFLIFPPCFAKTYDEVEEGYKKAFQIMFTIASDKAEKCTANLSAALANFLLRKNWDNFLSLCSEHEKLVDCIYEESEGIINEKHVLLLTSGIQFVCLRQKEAYSRFLPCVNRFAPWSESTCATECGLDTEVQRILTNDTLLGSVDSGTSYLMALTDTSGFCSSFVCHLNCTKRYLDTHCPGSGAKLMEIFTQPLDQLHELMELAKKKSIGFGAWINDIPRSCRNLIDYDHILHLRLGPNFEEKQTFFNRLRKSDIPLPVLQNVDKLGNRTHDIELDDFYARYKIQEFHGSSFEDFLTHIYPERRPKSWLTLQNALILIMVSSILLVSIVALVVSIMWCLSECQDEPIYGPKVTYI